jgi:hypothetical protein
LLFSAPGNNGSEHVAGLEVIDVDPVLFLIRNPSEWLDPHERRVYTPAELAGITKARDGYTDDMAPLPEFSRPYYPAGETSWELTILPPEPKHL